MAGSAATGSQIGPFMMVRGWLLFTMTGYRAALAAMAPMVASGMVSVAVPYMGKG